MDLAQQELQTRMAADAQAVWEKVLAKRSAGEAMTLSDIEAVVRAAGEQ